MSAQVPFPTERPDLEMYANANYLGTSLYALPSRWPLVTLLAQERMFAPGWVIPAKNSQREVREIAKSAGCPWSRRGAPCLDRRFGEIPLTTG